MKTIITFFTVMCLACVAYGDFNSGKATQMNSKEAKEMHKVQKDFPQDKFATPSDQMLNTKIREEVSLGYFFNSYKSIALNTNNGVVTLNGTIKNAEEAQKLIAEIKKINGVKAVNSQLQFTK